MSYNFTFVQSAMRRFGSQVTDDHVWEMIDEADMDGDSRISYDEFVRIMGGTSNAFVAKMASSKRQQSVLGRAGGAPISADLHAPFPAPAKSPQQARGRPTSLGDSAPSIIQVSLSPTRSTTTVVSAPSVVTQNATQSAAEMERLRQRFAALDIDGNGYVTAAELKRSLGPSVSLQHVREMIGEADIDGDSRISFNEFVAVMSKPSSLRSLAPKYVGAAQPCSAACT
jgi:Ca2+-binding EF-hand superfamily protein